MLLRCWRPFLCNQNKYFVKKTVFQLTTSIIHMSIPAVNKRRMKKNTIFTAKQFVISLISIICYLMFSVCAGVWIYCNLNCVVAFLFCFDWQQHIYKGYRDGIWIIWNRFLSVLHLVFLFAPTKFFFSAGWLTNILQTINEKHEVCRHRISGRTKSFILSGARLCIANFKFDHTI